MLKTLRMIKGDGRNILFNQKFIYTCLEMIFQTMPFIILYVVLLEIFNNRMGAEQIILWTSLLIISFVLQILFSVQAGLRTQINGAKDVRNLRIRLAEHLRTLPLSFFKRQNGRSLSQAMLTNIDEAEMALTHLFPRLISSFVLAILQAIVLIYIDWRLALLAFVFVPIALPLLFWSQKVMNKKSKQRHDAFAHASGQMLEYVENIQLLQSFRRTGSSFGRLDQSLARFRDDSIRVEAVASPILYLFSVVIELGFVMLVTVGMYLLIGGEVDMFIFFIALILSLQFIKSLKEVGTSLVYLRFLTSAGERVQKVLNENPLAEPNQSKLIERHSITFEDVSFRYGDKTVLEHIHLHIPAKSMVALVGPSGSGKSTILNLICRFWDIQDGMIEIGNTNIKDLHSEDLLESIALVSQDVQILNMTVEENLRMGIEAIPFEQVVEAAKLAHCHEMIQQLPNGYQTLLGSGGVYLSGGERQRISITRAFLKDAPILLLDEVTASLDATNEKLIQRSISKLTANKTVIVVAHRLKTIQQADLIYVFEKGSLKEQGTHEQLLNNVGLYRHLWDVQQRAGGWKLTKR